jgi:hypothetical protein
MQMSYYIHAQQKRGNFLMVLASTVDLGFGHCRDLKSYFRSFQDHNNVFRKGELVAA